MIVRPLLPSTGANPNTSSPEPAWQVFIRTQIQAEPPFVIIFQAEHSVLAGALAKALRPEIFGELPPEVLQAISEHDFGWKISDQAQMNSSADEVPRPFLKLTAEERLIPSRACVAHGRSLNVLSYVMISRHFTNLALSEPAHAEFVQSETEQRAQVERNLSYSPLDLDRWIGAVGFCDLLSLSLCSGSQHSAELPLAHPSEVAASKNAPKVVLSWHDGMPTLSPPVLQPGTRVSLDARIYSGKGAEARPVHLVWTFPNG